MLVLLLAVAVTVVGGCSWVIRGFLKRGTPATPVVRSPLPPPAFLRAVIVLCCFVPPSTSASRFKCRPRNPPVGVAVTVAAAAVVAELGCRALVAGCLRL